MSWFVPMMDAEPVSIEEKRQALARVLESRTFGRSEQLRAFLRYVCEAEFEGRAHELNEYALGVSVLGRSADYSPAADSCVRTRAYELRNKLDSYYRSEAPDDPVRIEIAKGAYVPRFERRFAAIPSAVPPNTVPPSETPPETASIPPAGNRRPFRTRWAVGLLIAAAAVACVLLARSWNGPEREPPKGLAGQSLSKGMRALWKPFLDSSAPLLISFEIRLAFSAPATGLVVRDYRTNRPEDAANSKPLTDFKARMGANDLQPTFDYADFGAVHAVFLLERLFAAQGREVALKHSNSLGWEDIRNTNIVFVGKPNLNPAIRYSLQGKDLVETEFGSGIRNVHPRPGEPDIYRSAVSHGVGDKYALITVMPGPQPGRRMMILSGAGAELMWALAEAVTNRAHVDDIMSHVRLPSGEAPAAFQVVIQATFEAYVPVRIRYVIHRVLAAL